MSALHLEYWDLLGGFVGSGFLGLYLDNRLSHDHRSPGVSTDEQQHVRQSKTRSRLSTGSASSCDSCDLHSLYPKESSHVSSPAISTMRPRFGKEYKRIDRKKLAEELNMPLPGQSSVSHSTEPSPSTPTVFTFECIPAASLRSPHSSAYSSVGDASPKYPHCPTSATRHSKDPAYVNLSFLPNSSSVILDSTPPPQSPGAHSILSENSEVLLNYAEIDLSESGKGKKPVRPLQKKGGVEYAVIDMVATAAASRVGREHAQLREDKLLQMNRYVNNNTSCSGSHSRGNSVTLPNHGKERRTTLGRSNSTSSRDKRS
ncbi:hypothetical protein LSH36_120g03051 [Paralvinella palmiformis]|uniref:Uncharacterized protein n=1 Tax=Paralvinella palmiformis TaxID=53620 RepID=A0AAD9NA78_9ANNE|nr:hypothetical protein LSH36_120g03051 [Paralvinella palmiformis]